MFDNSNKYIDYSSGGDGGEDIDINRHKLGKGDANLDTDTTGVFFFSDKSTQLGNNDDDDNEVDGYINDDEVKGLTSISNISRSGEDRDRDSHSHDGHHLHSDENSASVILRSNHINRRTLIIKSTVWIVVWMALNMMLQLANKYLVQIGFQFPIFVILTGTVATFVGCMLFMFGFKMASFPPREALMRRKWSLLVAALFQSATYVLENISIVTISITLNQIIKATAPVFVMGICLVWYREKYSWQSLIAIFFIVAGAVLAVLHNPDFVMIGFLYSISSTLFSALQTVIIASLLKDPTLNTFTILTVTSLPSALSIIPPFCLIELPRLIEHPPEHPLVPALLVVGLAIAAFAYNISHFYIVQYTSALYFAIVGNAKVVILIILSSFIFPTIPFLPINYFGMALTLLSFFAYNALKYRNQKKLQYIPLDEPEPRASLCLNILNVKKSPNSINSDAVKEDIDNDSSSILTTSQDRDKSPLINRGHQHQHQVDNITKFSNNIIVK